MSEKQQSIEEKASMQPAQEKSQGDEAMARAEKVKTPEEMEAEKAAAQKLELLMYPDFRDFAVRFMNMVEYSKMIRGGSSYRKELKRRQGPIYRGKGEGEVYVPKLEEGTKQPTFIEYLERSKENWLYSAEVETDWLQGVGGGHEAYTIAVILGLPLIDLAWREKRFGIRGYAWGAIRPEVKRREFAENLLGAIEIKADDTLVQELTESSSRSGKLAHPVFDSRGIVRWPQKMSYEEVKKFVAEREEKKKETNS